MGSQPGGDSVILTESIRLIESIRRARLAAFEHHDDPEKAQVLVNELRDLLADVERRAMTLNFLLQKWGADHAKD